MCCLPYFDKIISLRTKRTVSFLCAQTCSFVSIDKQKSIKIRNAISIDLRLIRREVRSQQANTKSISSIRQFAPSAYGSRSSSYAAIRFRRTAPCASIKRMHKTEYTVRRRLFRTRKSLLFPGHFNASAPFCGPRAPSRTRKDNHVYDGQYKF